MEKKCSKCGRKENSVVLIEYSFRGESKYICVDCLPSFIRSEGF